MTVFNFETVFHLQRHARRIYTALLGWEVMGNKVMQLTTLAVQFD